MTSPINNLQSLIFDNKEKLTDGAYKGMMDELKKVKEARDNTQYYTAVMSVMTQYLNNGNVKIQYGRKAYTVRLSQPFEDFGKYSFGYSGWVVSEGVLRRDDCPVQVLQYDPDPGGQQEIVHVGAPEMILVSLTPIESE